MSICWFCYKSLCIEKSVWNPFSKNCPVIWQYFVTCYAECNSFSKSMVGAFQNKYQSPYLLHQVSKQLNLKSGIPQRFPAHLKWNPKADSFVLFLWAKRILRGAVGNVVTYYRAWRGKGEGEYCFFFVRQTTWSFVWNINIDLINF